MKIPHDLEELISEQIRNEFESAYAYLGMAASAENMAFSGIAKWMRLQAKEEIEHGMKFFDYLHSRGSAIKLLPIAEAKSNYNSPLEVFQAALGHEKKITAMIHRLYDLAISLKEYGSRGLLSWFIAEQIEEEEQAQYFVDRLLIAGKDSTALLMIDKEAGKRSE